MSSPVNRYLPGVNCFWPCIFQIIQLVLKGFHKSRGCRTVTARKKYVLFKNHQNWKVDVSIRQWWNGEKWEWRPASQEPFSRCVWIKAGVFFISSPHPAGAGRWIDTLSVTSLFVKPFLNRIAEVESSPDLSVMSVRLSCRYVGDAGDSYRCRWPHLWQQCQAGVQHTARTAVLLCGASDRWGCKQEPVPGQRTSTTPPNTTKPNVISRLHTERCPGLTHAIWQIDNIKSCAASTTKHSYCGKYLLHWHRWYVVNCIF